LALATVVIVSFFSFQNVLSMPFTDTDEFSLIESSRIHSLSDVERIFTNQLFNGYGGEGIGIGQFYRPVSNLSYGLNYALWELDPFGYHLTDVLLHIITTVTAFFLIYKLSKRNLPVTWLGSLIFTIHPILIEVIPSSTRRHDILVTLFVLLSFLFFLNHLSRARGKFWLIASLFAFVLALGSKEIAVALPLIILSYLIIFPPWPAAGRKTKAWQAITATLPYLSLTIFFLLWRTIILRGTAGYLRPSASSLADEFYLYGAIIKDYFLDLLHPGGLAADFISSSPGAAAIVLSALGCLIFCFSLVVLGPVLYSHIREKCGPVRKIVIVAIWCGAVISLFLVISYPDLAFVYNKFMQKIYGGVAHTEFLTLRILQIDQAASLQVALFRGRNFFIILFSFLFFLFTLLALAISPHAKLKNLASDSEDVKLLLFLASWVLLPLIIFIATKTFCHYYIYFSIFPVSMIWALLIVRGVDLIRTKTRSYYSRGKDRFTSLKAGIAVLAFLACMSFFLVALPFENDEGEWSDNAVITQMLLANIAETMQKLPGDATLDINYIPNHITSHEAAFSHPRQVVYPYTHTLKSWLNLNYPGNNVTIITEEGPRIDLPARPSSLYFDVQEDPSYYRRYEVYVKYEFS
jgi:4-amino-4-deoxy-L-arabinose transferase-like glycosyltransferase